MTNIWFRSFLSMFMILILGVNMAYAFNMLNIINPTSLDANYSNYWFSFGSFMENFDNYFNHNDIIETMNKVLRSWQMFISKIYTVLSSSFQMITSLMGFSSTAGSIVGLLLAILTIGTNTIPLLLLLVYGLIFIITALVYAITFVLFIMSFFSGAFKTPLPNIYPELNEPLSIQMCIMRCLPIG